MWSQLFHLKRLKFVLGTFKKSLWRFANNKSQLNEKLLYKLSLKRLNVPFDFAYWLCKSPSGPPFRFRLNSISVFYTLYIIYTKCDSKDTQKFSIPEENIEARKYIETYINQKMAIKICQVKFPKILKLWDHPKTIGSSNKHEFNHKMREPKLDSITYLLFELPWI